MEHFRTDESDEKPSDSMDYFMVISMGFYEHFHPKTGDGIRSSVPCAWKISAIPWLRCWAMRAKSADRARLRWVRQAGERSKGLKTMLYLNCGDRDKNDQLINYGILGYFGIFWVTLFSDNPIYIYIYYCNILYNIRGYRSLGQNRNIHPPGMVSDHGLGMNHIL